MATASNILKTTKHLPEAVVCHALCGAVGEAATHNILTMMRMDTDLPSWEDIMAKPTTCDVPKNAASTCMLVLKAVQRVDKVNLKTWMVYMKRMSKEAQGLFARSLVSPKSPKKDMALNHSEFSIWCYEQNYIFASGK
jgi:hypothetical protein